jgi:hypothetical protein
LELVRTRELGDRVRRGGEDADAGAREGEDKDCRGAELHEVGLLRAGEGRGESYALPLGALQLFGCNLDEQLVLLSVEILLCGSEEAEETRQKHHRARRVM